MAERKRKLRIHWSCSNFLGHEHRWTITAWLCGWWQHITSGAAVDFADVEEDLSTLRSHTWTGQKAGGNPAEAGSYEWVRYFGLNTEGEICDKNGQPFSMPDGPMDDYCKYVAVGDIVGYTGSDRKYRITFVDQYTVKMVLA